MWELKEKAIHYIKNFLVMNRTILIVLTTIVIVSGITLAVIRGGNEPEEVVELESLGQSELEKNREEFFRYYSGPKLSNRESMLDRYSKGLALAELIEQQETDERQLKTFRIAKLNLMTEYAATTVQYESEKADDAQEMLIKYCRELTDRSSNDDLSLLADANLMSFHIIKVNLETTEQNVQEARDQVKLALPYLLKNAPKQLTRAANETLALGKKIESGGDMIKNFMLESASLYKSSGTELGKYYGSRILDETVLRGRNISRILADVDQGDFAARDKLLEIVKDGCNSDHHSELLCKQMMQAIETFDRVGASEFSQAAIPLVEQRVNLIKSPELKLTAQKFFSNYVARRDSLIGTDVSKWIQEFVDRNSNRKDFSYDARLKGNRMGIFFFDQSPHTISFANAITTARRLNQGFEEIYIYVELPVDPLDLGMSSIREQIVNLVRSTPGKSLIAVDEQELLMNQLKIDNAPFLLILDEDHKVAAVNMSPALCSDILHNNREFEE